MRPLLHFVRMKGSRLRAIASYQRQGNDTELEVGSEIPQRKDPSHHSRWLDNDLNFQPSTRVPNQTEIMTTGQVPDPERDDPLLTGTNVRHDVHVERGLL